MAPKPSSNESKRRERHPVTEAGDNEPYKVGPGRPPKETQFKPGQSGNPKGAKRKTPSIGTDLKAILERALSAKITLTQGETKRIMTKAEMGIEQLVNQYAKGDRHARRDLIAIADKLGVDLVTGQRHTAEGVLAENYQTILDAYVARQADTPKSSSVFAPPELLDNDNKD